MRLRLDPTGSSHLSRWNKQLEPARGRKRIVFFGDSRVERWQPAPQSSAWQVVNRGASSETTAQALERLDRDVLSLNPDVVIIQYGINDLKAIGLFPARAGAIERECEARLRAIVARIRARGIRVVVLTIFPVGPVPWQRRFVWSDATIDAVDRINRSWRDGTAEPGIEVVDCDRLLRSQHGPHVRPDLAADELHLNHRGYEILNRALEPILTRLLRDDPGVVQ